MWSDKEMLAKVEEAEKELAKEGDGGAKRPYKFGAARERYDAKQRAKELARKMLRSTEEMDAMMMDGEAVAKALMELPKIAELFEDQKPGGDSQKDKGQRAEIELFSVLANGVAEWCERTGEKDFYRAMSSLTLAYGRFVAEAFGLVAAAGVDDEAFQRELGDRSNEEAEAVFREVMDVATTPLHKMGCRLLKAAHEKMHEALEATIGCVKVRGEGEEVPEHSLQIN